MCALGVQRFHLSLPAGSRVHGDHIELDLALDNDKPLQESCISLSHLEDVRAVDFKTDTANAFAATIR
jgi:hypothetical protein